MKKIEPVVKKIALNEDDERNDLQFWLGRTPEERIEAMRMMREHYFHVMGYKKPPRIEKCVKKIINHA